jgi:hypothetical protein
MPNELEPGWGKRVYATCALTGIRGKHFVLNGPHRSQHGDYWIGILRVDGEIRFMQQVNTRYGAVWVYNTMEYGEQVIRSILALNFSVSF